MDGLDVLVLRGGPDRERAVSLRSGARVAAALREAGHRVTEADAGPGAEHEGALRDWLSEHAANTSGGTSGGGGVVFPVLHGPWGEGGGVQRQLEAVGAAYVGCGPAAAALCMDKDATKRAAVAAGVPTPAWELLERGQSATLGPPAVVKAVDEGSSLGLEIVGEGGSVGAAVERLLAEYPRVVVERFVAGREVTVGVVQVTSEKLKVKSGEGGGRGFAAAAKRATPVALPVLWIEPAGGVYDYDAKYDRQDTAYRFDHGLGEAAADRLQALAVATFEACGARDLGRVDFIVDGAGRPWMLEINTMPGFTDHSLLPMAAERAGLGMVGLCDGLVRRAGSRGVTSHKSQVTSDK